MNSRIVFRSVVTATVCLLGAVAIRAQAATPAPGAASKVGVINIRGAIGNTAEGKQAQAELQSKYAPRQNDIENLNKQINDVRQRLGACEGKCSQDEVQRLTIQGQRLTQQLDRKNNELTEDSNSDLGDIMDRIGRKMVDVLDRYARDNGYSVILDSSAQNTPVLYAQNDVTQDIVRLYDQAYPVKSAAPAATTPTKPPATTAKPTTSQPTPTPTKPQR